VKPQQILIIIGLSSFAATGFAQTALRLGNEPRSDLIKAVTTRPWPGENYPALPSLPSRIQEYVLGEIASPAIRRAYEKLDAKRSNGDWFKGIEELEREKAVWSLLSSVCHPHDDVQIHALRSLERLNDKRAVPFLLTYAEYMAVNESGSENATLHGIIQTTVAKTLSALTGVKVAVAGQDPETLKRGIKAWHKWLAENDVPDDALGLRKR
jgi:hypothetical protein